MTSMILLSHQKMGDNHRCIVVIMRLLFFHVHNDNDHTCNNEYNMLYCIIIIITSSGSIQDVEYIVTAHTYIHNYLCVSLHSH